jgi:HEAT repeat protein
MNQLFKAIGITWFMAGVAVAEQSAHYQLTVDGQVSEHTLSDWITRLKDTDPSNRRAAAEAIRGIYPDEAQRAIPALIPLLRDPSETVRQAAAETLGGFGSDARGAVHGLIQQFSDPVEPVRNAASAALYYVAINRDRGMDPEPESALQAAIQGLAGGSQNVDIRTQLVMVDTLGTFACVDSPRSRPCQNLTAPAIHDQSIQLLIGIIRNRQLHSLVRERACGALGAFRRQARRAVPVLLKLIQQGGEEEGLRTAAVQALAKVEP